MRYILLLFVIVCCLEAARTTAAKLTDVVDLSWPFDNSSTYWPGIQPFKFTKQVAGYRTDGIWYSYNEFCAGEHGGTHFDAPYHFSEVGWKVGDVPLENLVAKGITIDLRDDVNRLQDTVLLLPEHLEAWEKEHGAIQNNSVVLVKFGWAKYYHNKTEYLGTDEQGKLHFPGLSAAAAEWIAQSGKIVGVGVDSASIDPGNGTDFAAHRILSEKQIYLLENVNIPQEFPASGFMLIVMPMKIAEGSGAPLRLIALPFPLLEGCQD